MEALVGFILLIYLLNLVIGSIAMVVVAKRNSEVGNDPILIFLAFVVSVLSPVVCGIFIEELNKKRESSIGKLPRFNVYKMFRKEYEVQIVDKSSGKSLDLTPGQRAAIVAALGN